jgi:dienelactone hydrolase
MSAPTGLQLTIAPSPARVDDPLTIVVAGARPGQTVTVRARMRDGLGRRWESHATFAADERGEIHVARQRPLAGTYEDPDPRGLLWSMRLAEGQAAGLLTSAAPLETEVVAESAQMSPATARVRRHFATPAVTRTEVRDNGLVATFFRPSGSTPHPAVIVVPGSGGGVPEPSAALLASHGIASLALAYFRAEHLPESLVEIPLEYFEGAIRWLRAQPAVGTRPLGVMGGSRGGELALLLGATFSDFRAVVGNVPSGIVHAGIAGGARETHPRPAWTYRGQPVPFLSPRNAGQMASAPVTSAPLPLAPIFLRAMQDRAAVEAATIPVERINGPVLLISGQDDQMWPSPALAEIAMKRLAERRFRFPYAHLSYPGAGHVIGQPGMPSTVTASLHPLAGRWLAYGGNPKDNAAAAADSWPKIIAFFREALGAP